MRINSEWLIVELLSPLVKMITGFFDRSLWPAVFRWAVYCGLAANFGNTVGPAPTEEYPRRNESFYSQVVWLIILKYNCHTVPVKLLFILSRL